MGGSAGDDEPLSASVASLAIMLGLCIKEAERRNGVAPAASGKSGEDVEAMLTKLEELGRVDQLEDSGRRDVDGTLPEAINADHASWASGASSFSLVRRRLGETARGWRSWPLSLDSLAAEPVDLLR